MVGIVVDHVVDLPTSRAVIEALGRGPVTGVGLSRGSNLLVRLAVAYPKLVERMVLVGSPVDDSAPGCRFPRPEGVTQRYGDALSRGDYEAVAAILVLHVYSESETGDLAEAARKRLLRLPRDTFLSFFQPDGQVDIAQLLSEVKAPTLVTVGTADKQVPIESSRYIAERIPGAQFYAFEGRGHLPVFTATAEFCQVLTSFVRRGTVPEPARAQAPS